MLPPSETHPNSWSAARRLRGWVATWVQDRRRGRRPLLTVEAVDLTLAWGYMKSLDVNLQVGRLALGKFVSFQMRYRLASAPGAWTNSGTVTNFSPTLLLWNIVGPTEGQDYVFELTVTETSGVVTVTEELANIGFA
jgi:hypothetical protein